MPPKQTNRLPLCTANKRGSTETIGASIGRGTPSLASRITTPIEHVSLRGVSEDMIDESEREDHNSDDHNEEVQPTSHGDDDDDCGNTVESEVTTADMRDVLEQQRKLVAILF